MSEPIKLIVGLGNPGAEYEHTRHNAGAWFVTRLANAENISLAPERKFYGLAGRGNIAGEPCWLLVPTTFMNLSGQAVAALAGFYKISPEQILVVHDELDLPAGSAKFKTGGGHGGQNGLRDIISKLGNNQSFNRLRIGIGHPGDKSRVTGHVLSKPSANEQKLMDEAIDNAIAVITQYVKGDKEKAMSQLHAKK